jgi:hypothetical protein
MPRRQDRLPAAVSSTGAKGRASASHINVVSIEDRKGVKTNNHLRNLHWGTPSRNTLDSVRNGTHIYARKTECGNGHEFTPENTRIDKRGARACRTCAPVGQIPGRAQANAGTAQRGALPGGGECLTRLTRRFQTVFGCGGSRYEYCCRGLSCRRA